MIEGNCGNCGVKYSVDDAHAGKTSQCLMCEAEIRIPESGDAARESAAAETGDGFALRSVCQITTTDAIHGWTIVGYKGLVTAHVVAGTGFFSDFSASWTDVFGGRSQTYQRQLAAIEEEAIDELCNEAIARGANWVIGTRIDFDEISGKGMQMFMVSMQGTAVRAIPSAIPLDTRHVNNQVSGTVVQAQMRKEALLRRVEILKTSGAVIPDDVLESICEFRLLVALPLCADVVLDEHHVQSARSKQLAMQALRLAPRQVTRDILHGLLVQNPQLSGASALYRDLGLLDLRWALQQIEGPDKHGREVGLQVLTHAVAATYTEQDIEVIHALQAAIPRAFPETAREVETKGLLGGKATKWRCENGHDSPLDVRRCVTCDIDRRGLYRRDFGLDSALRALDSTLTVLESVFRR